MENASKALIIAGAILLSILLISLGIMIFNQAQDTINNSGMSQAEKTAFNQKFTKYEGNRKGSEVRSLIQEAMVANSDENNQDAGIKITIYYTANGSSQTTLTSSTGIKNTTTYSVGVYYSKSGYVDEIQIVEGKNQPTTEKQTDSQTNS